MFVIPFALMYGCGDQKVAAQATNTAAPGAPADKKKAAVDSPALARIKIANETDPVCGMPLIRGYEDTTMYIGKIIGFCSHECKDDFMKKPSAYRKKLK